VKFSPRRIYVYFIFNHDVHSVKKIVEHSGAKEVHIASMVDIESPMRFRNMRPVMGQKFGPSEFMRMVTDADRVKEYIQAISRDSTEIKR